MSVGPHQNEAKKPISPEIRPDSDPELDDVIVVKENFTEETIPEVVGPILENKMVPAVAFSTRFSVRGTPDRPNYFFNPDSASQSANASQVKMNAALLQASQDLPVDSALPQKSKIYRFPSTKVDLSSQTSEETQVQIMAALLEASQDLPETPVSEQKDALVTCTLETDHFRSTTVNGQEQILLVFSNCSDRIQKVRVKYCKKPFFVTPLLVELVPKADSPVLAIMFKPVEVNSYSDKIVLEVEETGEEISFNVTGECEL